MIGHKFNMIETASKQFVNYVGGSFFSFFNAFFFGGWFVFMFGVFDVLVSKVIMFIQFTFKFNVCQVHLSSVQLSSHKSRLAVHCKVRHATQRNAAAREAAARHCTLRHTWRAAL